MKEKPLVHTGPLAPRPLRGNDPLEPEKIKANLAHLSEQRLELLRSAVKAGESGLKMLLVINGGAAVALLAFLGNVLTKNVTVAQFSVPNLKEALLRFVAGVAVVGVGAVARFLSLYAAMLQRQRAEVVFSWAALSCGLVSLGTFAFGCWWVVGALY